MAEKDKLRKDNEEMRMTVEDLENRLEHSQVTNVRQGSDLQTSSC